MIQAGLIERTNSATRRPRVSLQTTEAGRERRRLAARVGAKLETHLLKPLNDAQRAQLLELIEMLTEWVYGDATNRLDADLMGRRG